MITIMTIAILVSYMKPLIAQPKPPESQRVPNLPEGFQLESDSLLTEARNFSYPSNHTAIITAFALHCRNYLATKKKKICLSSLDTATNANGVKFISRIKLCD